MAIFAFPRALETAFSHCGITVAFVPKIGICAPNVFMLPKAVAPVWGSDSVKMTWGWAWMSRWISDPYEVSPWGTERWMTTLPPSRW